MWLRTTVLVVVIASLGANAIPEEDQKLISAYSKIGKKEILTPEEVDALYSHLGSRWFARYAEAGLIVLLSAGEQSGANGPEFGLLAVIGSPFYVSYLAVGLIASPLTYAVGAIRARHLRENAHRLKGLFDRREKHLHFQIREAAEQNFEERRNKLFGLQGMPADVLHHISGALGRLDLFALLRTSRFLRHQLVRIEADRLLPYVTDALWNNHNFDLARFLLGLDPDTQEMLGTAIGFDLLERFEHGDLDARLLRTYSDSRARQINVRFKPKFLGIKFTW